MKLLFVCSANKQRSKTAEDYFASKYPSHDFQSAGTNLKICRAEGTTSVTESLLRWADVVYVMEQSHRNQIKSLSRTNYFSKIIILNIPDVYKYYDSELITLLEDRVLVL